MPTAEVRLASQDVATRIDEMRRWLAARGVKPVRLGSTGSSNETVLHVEFDSTSDAAAFATEFSGTLLDGASSREPR